MNIIPPMTGPVTTTDFPPGELITNETFATVFVGLNTSNEKMYFDAGNGPSKGQQVFPSGSDIFELQTNAKVEL